MRNFARILAGIAAVGVAVLVGRLDAAPPVPKAPKAATACENPQSPRKLENWDHTSTVPIVTPGEGDSITYSPPGGGRLVLHPCSQHYHCQVENVQACPGQQGSTEGACPATLDWVEIHTAYHQGPSLNPLPEDLGKCDDKDGKPIVVVGYHARATSGPAGPPVPVLFGPPAAEWSGSSTNVGPPSCKGPAFWHFALGCDVKVSALQLRNQFHHPDRARALQARDRLSHDLTRIEVSKKPK